VKSLLLQVVRFGAVGAAATLMHALVYALVVANRWTSPLAANTIAYLCALGISFVGHRHWTFATEAAHAARPTGDMAALVRYATVSLLGYVLNAAAVAFIVDVLRADPMFALLPMLTIVPAIVFVLSRFWVFRP
jgi:putative flippase GtrA